MLLYFLLLPVVFLPVLGFVRPQLARVLPCTGGKKGGETFGREPGTGTPVPQQDYRCTLPVVPGAALLWHRCVQSIIC